MRTSISNRGQRFDSLFLPRIWSVDQLTINIKKKNNRSLYITQIRYPRRRPPNTFSDFELDTNMLISAVDPQNTGILIRRCIGDNAVRTVFRGRSWTCWRLMINRDWLAVVPSLALALIGKPIPPHPDMPFGNLLDRKHHALRELSPAEICQTAELREHFLTVHGDCVSDGLIRVEFDLRIGARVCS